MRKSLNSPVSIVLTFCCAVGLTLLAGCRANAAAPAAVVPVKLAANGAALLPVVVGEKAGDGVKKQAHTLAEMLGKISGAAFTVTTGDGVTGIAVGMPSDFPKPPVKAPFDVTDVYRREDYLLRSHAKGIYLLGATELAVQHAVWDLLGRLGYRQYFPGPTWEIIPAKQALSLAVDTVEHPDYFVRNIWYGYGSTNMAEYKDWSAKNRMASGIAILNLHYYHYFINENKAEFAAHPEYYGLVKGERKSWKLCASNPELRKLVADTALRYFEKYPDRDCISLEPTDGGGWCECDDCKPIRISDRVVMLANAAAEAVAQRYGNNKFVGILAYWEHCLPPTLKVHQQINVCVANGLMADNTYNVYELLDRWGKQSSSLGVYEYFSVNTWWRDLPGRPLAAKLNTLQYAIPRYHEKGARVYSAESNDNWGAAGLGYYFANRMLWDINEAKRKDAIVAEFLDNCFGAAKKPMAEYYDLTNGSHPNHMMDDIVGRMYRKLHEARQLTTDAQVLARLDDLILYARYVEMFKTYQKAKDEARQQAFEAVLRHVYRMRKTGMVSTVALFQDIHVFDKKITLPSEAAWFVPEGKNPWKSSEPFTRAEIDAFLAEGVKNNDVLPFTPVRYSNKLVPATPLQLPAVPRGEFRSYNPSEETYYTWVAPGQREVKLKTNGVRTWKLFAGMESEEPLDVVKVDKSVPLKTPLTDDDIVSLKTTATGLHRLTRLTGGGAIEVDWDGIPMTFRADRIGLGYSDTITLYFYVPKGVKEIIGYGQTLHGAIFDPTGAKSLAFKDVVGQYYTVPVPAGMDGKLWSMKGIQGSRPLYSVPPYLARSAEELLLPAEVVEADQTKPAPRR